MTTTLTESNPCEADNLATRVTHELVRLEKRDWELWLIVALSGIVGGCVLLCLLFPSTFLQQSEVHLELTISKRLFFFILALLILLNTYVATRRAELRRLRRRLIASTIDGELVRLQSFTDPLTEVYNRRSLDEMVARYISRARRTQEPLTFLVVDLDRFKEVNTRFGHITGDFVLSEVAGLIRNSTRGSDTVVRYGGDEFLIVLGNTSKQNAGVVVERIHDYLRRWNENRPLDNFKLTISVGLGEWTDGKTLDEVLDAADQDMYECKRENVAGNTVSRVTWPTAYGTASESQAASLR
jgi:diguanylate cyclase (GGDEF)-like protein